MNEWKIDKELGKEVYGRVENYTDEEKQILWDKIKNELQEYEPFIGTIFVKAPFGVFLDIGKEFPALLRLPAIKNIRFGKYSDYMDDKIYNLGEKLEVYFVGMNDKPDKLVVTEFTKEARNLQKENLKK
jgi:ribosomal protein S1